LFYVGGPKTDPLPAPWYYIGLLFFATVLNYLLSRAIYQLSDRLDSPDPQTSRPAHRLRRIYLLAALVGNLSLLGYYKYTNFFLQAFSDIATRLGFSVAVPHLSLILPLGISFYTFQCLSYTIDVWRRRLTPEPSFRKFALFVVFFPQLVAGPILRASDFLPQLHRGPRLDPRGMEEGLFRIFKGLVKKVVLGDWIAAQFTDRVFDQPGGYSSAEILLALYAFTLQLYADFAGYSDLGIGLGRLLGFHIPENFQRPYQSRSLAEFWRRWHMTLSTWLRDYLFFPLGGSRCGPRRAYFNLWLTMILVGMWHGASWNFVLYSNLHAAAMVFNRWNRTRSREGSWSRRILGWLLGLGVFGAVVAFLAQSVLLLPRDSAILFGAVAALVFLLVAWLPETGTPLNTALHVLLTFHFTVLSRVFFRADSLATSRELIQRLWALDGRGIRPDLFGSGPWGIAVWLALGLGLAYHFTPQRWVDEHLLAAFRRVPGLILGLALALLGLGLMLLTSAAPRAFIYFQF
jgi:D-alanyl-lipoteichoic acid acyltransferase DltB (MBOAT superfamily)